ncbi:hypothetical protein SAM40697_4919 [Streptomyces ambofaciens]|uniref:Lipoprotein n=1 Tax=Streptomyces ambofaciens TaxID=1889 RepID=A0ABN4PC31_STRAM|nr:hypothetical protein [Streptomyces ambofaciens]ANB08876.1 hypothetical protein SAM40697_4919 [Streptomyces ambofaciens]
MSLSSSLRPAPGPRRRSLLASATGAALLVGCTGGSGSGDTDADPSAVERARARAARDSEELAGRYAAVAAAHPGLAERLRPLHAEVVRHAEAFGAVRAASPEASPSVSARAAGPQDGSGPVPTAATDALALLVAAERKLADRRVETLVGVPGELARLLASVAAAGAAHVYLLTEGDG